MFKWLNNIFVKGWVEATKFITTNGTSSQFVKGDGSLDDNTYALESDLDGLASETYVDTAIDDIEIGGRNYILTPKDSVSNNVYRRVRIENGVVYWEQLTNSTAPYSLNFSQPIIKGDYIISFKSNTSANIRRYIASSGTKHFTQTETIQINENEWLITGLLLNLETSTTSMSFYGTSPFEPTKEVAFWDFKLEKGTIPTDWTPAPEDQITDWNQTIPEAFDYLKNKPTKLSDFINDGFATETWVNSQGFLTEETDNQTLSWNDVTGALSISNGNSVDLDGRYLQSFTEADPTVPSHVKLITTTEKSNWNTAYGWGDHSIEGYLTSVGWNDIIGTQSNINLSGFNDDLDYDNYGSWNLKTNGVQRTTIQSDGILDLVAGTNIGLSYGAGGVITITATDTNNNDIDYVSNVQLNGTSLDFTGVGNAFNSSVDLSSLLDNTNYYLDNLTFNTDTGILTASVNGATNQTVDLDGRYVLPDDIILREGIGANSTYRIGMASDTDAAGDGSIVIASLSSASGDYSGVIAGNKNNIEEHCEKSGIFAGDTNKITNGGATNAIIGGNNNIIEKTANSAIIGGEGNYIYDVNRSVILGGIGITATEDDMVYAPNYKVTEDNNTDNAEYVAMVVQSQYGTSDPTASAYPEGTILIKYD